MAKEYLGDSVYAQYLHGDLVLTTENGATSDPSNAIVLKESVLRALFNYIERNRRPQDVKKKPGPRETT